MTQDLSLHAPFFPGHATPTSINNNPMRRKVAGITPWRVVLFASGAIIAFAPFATGTIEPVAVLALTVFLAILSLWLRQPHIALDPASKGVISSAAFLAFHAVMMSALGFASIRPPGSIAPTDTLLSLYRTVALVLLYALVCHHIARPSRRFWMLGAIFAIILAHATFALLREVAEPGGLSGPFVNRNSFASFIGMGILVGLSLSISARRWQGQKLDLAVRLAGLWVANGLLVAALVLTQSRMGVTATCLGAAVLLVHRAAWKEALLLAGVLAAALVWFGPDLLGRFGFLPDDLSMRLLLYGQIYDMIAARPFTGYGAGTFALAFEAYHAPPLPVEFIWDRAHSTYLKLWAENGVLFGSIPILGGFILALRLAARRGTSRHQGSGGTSVALGALVLCASHSVFDFSFELLGNQVVLVALLALGTPGTGCNPKEIQGE